MYAIMIEIGLKGKQEIVVTEEVTADKVGSGLVKVLATPMLVALMEKTCNDAMLPLLDAGQGTVGTHIDISHCAATPIGMRVWCECELVEVDRRRLLFEVKAFDDCGLVGEGRHERFVIDMAKFQAKVDAKKESR